MSRNAKIILGVLIGAVIVLCLCACMMAAAVSGWFINRTVTVGTDSVQRTVDRTIAIGPHQLQVDGAEIAATILSGGRR